MDKKELGLFMARTFKSLGGSIAQNFRENGIDLPMEQFVVLDMLHQYDDMIQQDLSEKLSKDKSGVLRIIDGLESKQLVVRVPDSKDRRKKYIKVTDKGLELFKQVESLEATVLSNALNGLTDEDLARFEDYLKTISDNIVRK